MFNIFNTAITLLLKQNEENPETYYLNLKITRK